MVIEMTRKSDPRFPGDQPAAEAADMLLALLKLPCAEC